MQEAQRKQEHRLQQNILKYKQMENDKEMGECTFSPRLVSKNEEIA